MCIAPKDHDFNKGQDMSDRYDDRQTGDSRDSAKKSASQTSGSREEGMKDSGKDSFGEKKAKSDRSSADQADGTKRDAKLDPASSGTAPLAGETPDSSDRQSPGGVEGTGNNT